MKALKRIPGISKAGKRVLPLLASGALIASTAVADDIEIYTNTESLGVNPNILFVIDTSGSMGADVEISSYDPAIDYTVPAGSDECLDDRIYVRLGGSTPSCSTNYWFQKNIFRCAAGWEAMDMDNTGVGTGYFVDRIGRWNNSAKGWYSLHDTFYQYRPASTHYECRSDNGIHGETTASTAKYIRNGGSYGPFSTNSSYANSIWQNISNRTIYTANYLNWYHYHGGSAGGIIKSRLEIVVDAAKDLIDSVSNVNIGLARFDTTGTWVDGSTLSDWGNTINNHGGPISYPPIDVTDSTNKATLKGILDTFTTSGSTPLVETVTEGLRMFRGEAVNFGAPWTNGNLSSHANSQTGGSYITPIEYDCGNNYMVVFSDGAPTADWDADNYVNGLISGTDGDMGSCNHDSSSYFAADSCLDELANYMYNADHSTDTFGNNLPGKQNIVSYYVSGFDAADDALMNAAALKGGTGSAYEASNPSEFAEVFSSILADIAQVNASFTSPAVSVNALNRLRHNNDLYFALFQPTRKPHWPGNIKKYRLETTGTDADGDGEPDVFIGDAHNPPMNAVDDTTGLFVADGGEGSGQVGALSYWYLDENNPDGDRTTSGGAAHRLFDWDATTGYDADSRQYRVYTYLTDYAPNATEFDGTGISLTTLHEDNASTTITGEDGINITKATLGLASTFPDAEFLKRIMWARGVDVLDDDADLNVLEGRPVMGGVLHTEPILVNYAVDDNSTPLDESDDTQTNVLFTTTNDGYFHIMKSDDSGLTGKPRLEHSAVMPKPQLKGIDELYLDSGTDVAYRLDSNLDIWRYEDPADTDDDITTGGNDFVYAYFGQRRGGNVIYAFDVTNPDYPELLWVIDPSTLPANSTDPDIGPFQYMGQTWSKPKKHKLLVPNGTNTDLTGRDIVIFGGGYDNDSDDIADLARNQDSFGSAIYIVDAKTGELLWWAGYNGFANVTPDFGDADMKYGFTADIRITDINGDGFADKIFATDTGGQVWRFDIANALNVGDALNLASRITGGVIADLQLNNESDTETAANNRRLYYSPDVALVQKDDASSPFLTISVGSGYRAHPLNETINDKFFVLKYDDVINKPADEYNESGVLVQDGYDRVKIYVDDLLDVTNLNFAEDPAPTLSAADAEALDGKGWFINLVDDGEKALSESVTVDGNVIFTTYTPPADDANTGDGQECSGNQGGGKTYVVSVIDGRPVFNLDGVGSSSELELTDRVFNLKVSGIPPRPKVVFPDIDGVSGKVIVGRELLPVNIANAPELTYWAQE